MSVSKRMQWAKPRTLYPSCSPLSDSCSPRFGSVVVRLMDRATTFLDYRHTQAKFITEDPSKGQTAHPLTLQSKAIDHNRRLVGKIRRCFAPSSQYSIHTHIIGIPWNVSNAIYCSIHLLFFNKRPLQYRQSSLDYAWQGFP